MSVKLTLFQFGIVMLPILAVVRHRQVCTHHGTVPYCLKANVAAIQTAGHCPRMALSRGNLAGEREKWAIAVPGANE